MKEKLLKIIGHYGFDNQIKKLNEEVFELIEALFLDLRVAEELADVLVMLEQFRLCYGISEEELKKIMEEKVDRQLNRIREERESEK